MFVSKISWERHPVESLNIQYMLRYTHTLTSTKNVGHEHIFVAFFFAAGECVLEYFSVCLRVMMPDTIRHP